jgi:predicted dehydrogenase
LCEKPLCWTRAQAERLFDAATANDRVLAEAFMYLHSPLMPDALAIARSAMHDPDASPIGTLTKIVARFDISIEDGWEDTPKTNIRYSRALVGGALMDLGCYPVSLARTLTGEAPASLGAQATMVDRFAGTPNDGTDAVDGAVSITGAFPSGVAFELTCSMIEPMKDRGGRAPEVVARLIGDKGAAEIRDFPRPERILLMGERIEGGERWIESPLADPAEVYRVQAESFARAVADGGAAKPSAAWSIEQAGVLERALGAIGQRFDEPGW